MGPTNSISWGDPGDQIYNENGPFLLFLNYFSAISIVALVVLSDLRRLVAPPPQL